MTAAAATAAAAAAAAAAVAPAVTVAVTPDAGHEMLNNLWSGNEQGGFPFFDFTK
jgi:hypothetical protein